MRNRIFVPKPFIAFMVFVFSIAMVQIPAQAALMTTEQLAASAQHHLDREQLSAQLLREDVKNQLLVLGVDPASVQERINNLTQAEIQQIQGQLNSLPAGGDGLGTVAMVLLILILLEVTGIIDIFPRI
ncbi:MAG: PA2779 family protein [Porticoccaceae bacterium]|nr:PA2779 family protein [Porticoccaceae bacterium]